MKASEAWKNFNLGEELDISGTFIYNGLRRFYEIQKLDNSDEIFEILYNLSVGLERLLKIAIILIEHDDACSIQELERSLITHNHLALLDRVRKQESINLGKPHFEFLTLLARFYRTF